jgi:hypothetical protein
MDKLSAPGGVEIFGAPGVGKSTFIRNNGFVSSQDVYHRELDKLIRKELRRKYFVPLPGKILRSFRRSFESRFDEEAVREFGEAYREFLDLCFFVIFNSPVSPERRIRCYRFLIQAILSWWLVKDREGMIWDESFAKAVLYVCGMEPEFSGNISQSWFG